MPPLILIVGFLGSGKTTYLRRLLPELRGRGIDPHVIINDYQNARVDAELLRELAVSIVPNTTSSNALTTGPHNGCPSAKRRA